MNYSLATKKIHFSGGFSWAGTPNPIFPNDGEGNIRKAKLKPFDIDDCAVTHARFLQFVSETNYVTDAEKLGWSFVFRGQLPEAEQKNNIGISSDGDWWLGVEGANWKRPLGLNSVPPASTHPVVHISWNDANAFAEWANGRLPVEIEWEHAARGGTYDVRYPWGDHEPNDTEIFCNIWQGNFPHYNSCRDGFFGTAPVDAFRPNHVGMFNMCGNVWEWTANDFSVRSMTKRAKERNNEARLNAEKVLKGGSFLCHTSYCWRYRIAARVGRSPDSSASHIGFRVAYQ